MSLKLSFLLLLATVGVAAAADLPRSAAPEGARVYFIAPLDGEILDSPVTVRFGLVGMGIAPAGVQMQDTGHHHLLIDTGLPPLDAPMPADAHHLHFGKGQTEATIELAAGRHQLQLLLGDYLHVSHDPPIVSGRITITVR